MWHDRICITSYQISCKIQECEGLFHACISSIYLKKYNNVFPFISGCEYLFSDVCWRNSDHIFTNQHYNIAFVNSEC